LLDQRPEENPLLLPLCGGLLKGRGHDMPHAYIVSQFQNVLVF